MTNEAVNEIEAAIIDAVDAYHQAHPLRVGMPLATLSKSLEVPPEVAEYVVETSDNIARNEHEVSRSGHEVAVDAQSEEAWLKAREQLAAGLAVPPEGDLGLTPEMIHLKQRSGELVRIGPGLVYLTSQVDEMVETLRGLDDDFTVAEFRDATGLSRKYAVPFLEWTDKEGLTTRRGDTRRAR